MCLLKQLCASSHGSRGRKIKGPGCYIIINYGAPPQCNIVLNWEDPSPPIPYYVIYGQTLMYSLFDRGNYVFCIWPQSDHCIHLLLTHQLTNWVTPVVESWLMWLLLMSIVVLNDQLVMCFKSSYFDESTPWVCCAWKCVICFLTVFFLYLCLCWYKCM